jgi:hypothetical protein
MLFEGALNLSAPDKNTWDKWAKVLYDNHAIVHKLGGSSGVGHLRWQPDVAQRTVSYLALASGYRTCYGGPSPYTFGGHEQYQALQYGFRFGEFLFGRDYEILPLEQEEVQVIGHERLLWKYFVRRRQLEKGLTEWVIHLLNRPEGDTILAYHDAPPPREGTKVTLPLAGGHRVVGAWMAVPEPPRATPQDYRVEGDRVTVDLDDIESFATAVVRM